MKSFPHHHLTQWHHKKKYSWTNSRHKYQINVRYQIKTSTYFCSTITSTHLPFSHSRPSQTITNITRRYKNITAKSSHPHIPLVYLRKFSESCQIIFWILNSESISWASFSWPAWTYIISNLLHWSIPTRCICNNHLSDKKGKYR